MKALFKSRIEPTNGEIRLATGNSAPNRSSQDVANERNYSTSYYRKEIASIKPDQQESSNHKRNHGHPERRRR